MGNDPFWALVALVVEDDSIETLKEASKRQEKTDTEVVYDEEDSDEEDDMNNDDDEEEEDVDDLDLEKLHFFDCTGCKAIFREKADLLHHVTNCDTL